MRAFLIFGSAFVIVAGLSVCALCFVPASVIYSIKTTYLSAPDSDDELRDWLIVQPGIVENTIHIKRTEQKELILTVIVTQNSWESPPFPDVESKCTQLGYELLSPFTKSN